MKKEFFFRIVLLSLSMVVSATILETLLRYKGVFATYEEQTGKGGYASTYPESPANLESEVYTPFVINQRTSHEFVHNVNSNSVGCNDKEWSIAKHKKRIFCLGDSFTEGIGATNDSAYPAILQHLLGDSFEVCNAGISGHDIVMEYELLQKKLLPYQPDYLLISINQTDIIDIIKRGGSERYDTTKPFVNKNPWWNDIYGASYLFRFFIHKVLQKNRLFLTQKQAEAEKKIAEGHIIETIKKFQSFSKKNGVGICFVMMPMRAETQSKTYELQQSLQFMQKENICAVNALDYFNRHGIDSASVDEIHWRIDGHYNNSGYALLARAVVEKISLSP